MKPNFSTLLWAAIILVSAGARFSVPLRAQNPDTLTPEANEAKGREILQQAITALGGQAYLNVRDINRTGRFAVFDSSGDLGGYAKFEDFIKLPDNNRIEYYNKRNIIDVITGHGGWSLDRGGVTVSQQTAVDDYVESLKRNMHNLLRTRLKEEGLHIRYSGTEIIDMRPAVLVEIMDKEHRITIIAFDQFSHLPARTIFIRRNPETTERYEDREFYSTYYDFDGVKTAKKVYRERNGRKIQDVFVETCRYNTNIPDSLFSKASLEERWRKLGGKK